MRNNFGLGFIFEAVDRFSGPVQRMIGPLDRLQTVQRDTIAAFSQSLNTNRAALAANATATQRTRAKVLDLVASIDRNRAAQAALRADILVSGDADGKKRAALKALASATSLLSRDLTHARGELKMLGGKMAEATQKAKQSRMSFVALGTAIGTALGNVAANGLTHIKNGVLGIAGSAIDFESSMADVKKVLPEGTELAPLTEGVKRLSKDIGIMPTQVAALTASLAQSGIAGDELIATAEDASKLAVAFGMSGEESGQAIAKLRTGLGITREEVNMLTGSINELSNNMAATAPQIIDATQRVGSVAKAANISATTTAGLATAMIASGASSETAGTGVKNFIRALAAGDAATKRMKAAWKELGLDGVKVAKRLSQGGATAEDAIREVVQKFGDLDQYKRLPNMIRLFGAESIGAIGPLATNLKLLNQALGIAGDKTKTASSVQREYAARSATTENAINVLKANIAVLAVEIGTRLLPAINGGVQVLNAMVEGLRTLGGYLVEAGTMIGTYLERPMARVRLFYDAMVQAFTGGGFSGAVRRELNQAENAGIKRFVINAYALFHRFKVFVDGVTDGFAEAWKWAGPAVIEVFTALKDAFFTFVNAFSGADSLAATSSVNRWRVWGELLGKTLGTIIGWLAKVVGWVARFTADHPNLVRAIVIGVAAWKVLGSVMWHGFMIFHAVRRAIVAMRVAWLAFQVVLLANPVAAILAGVAIAALAVYEYWEPISGFFSALWDGVVSAFKGALDWILQKIDWAYDKLRQMKDTLLMQDTYDSGSAEEQRNTLMQMSDEQLTKLKDNPVLGGHANDILAKRAQVKEGLAGGAEVLGRSATEFSAARQDAIAKTRVPEEMERMLADLKEMQAANAATGGGEMSVNVVLDGEVLAQATAKAQRKSASRGYASVDPYEEE